MSRYHEKREKNNVAVKKFRKDKSVKDLGKMKQLELVRMVTIWKMLYLASKALSLLDFKSLDSIHQRSLQFPQILLF